MGASRELWPDENSLFDVLYDKFMFWSIIVGAFTFTWMFIAILRFRDGIEPAGKEELKVGTFPKERHNLKLELAWFAGPTVLIIWVTYIAFGSMNIIWGAIPDPDETFTIEVNGVQWEWEYRYKDGLTWEDPSADFDVSWSDTLEIYAASGVGFTANVIQGSNTWSLDLIDGIITNNSAFDDFINSSVTITDADNNILHTWAHIPEGQLMMKHFFIPCDEDVMFNLHSDKYGDKNGVYQGVQHAFWLQEWGNKEDIVPGLDGGTWMYVQPNDAGTFPVRCAEYCGEYHSVMTGTVTVVAKEGYSCDTADYGVVFANKLKEA